MNTFKKPILALTLLLGTLILSGNTIFQWTDENGVVHFSQTAPENNQNAVETTLRGASKTGGNSPAPVVAATKEPAEQDAPVEATETSSYTKIPENCERARAMLATLSDGSSRQLRLRDPETGEYSIATEQDRANQRERAQSQIEKDC